MKKYTTSGKSDRDITDIYKYSVVNFGFAKAGLYLEGLYQTFPGLATVLALGRHSQSARRPIGASNMKAI
jgi:plasmid stabilization system protein ParE